MQLPTPHRPCEEKYSPQARLSATACSRRARLRLSGPSAGHTLDLKAIQDYMAENRVAKQNWPERIEIVADLPKTPAGKVQKFQLRELAKAFGDAAARAS